VNTTPIFRIPHLGAKFPYLGNLLHGKRRLMRQLVGDKSINSSKFPFVFWEINVVERK
jgi:hypothetical protein